MEETAVAINDDENDNEILLVNILTFQAFPVTLSKLDSILSEKIKEQLFGRIHLVSANFHQEKISNDTNSDEEKVKNTINL